MAFTFVTVTHVFETAAGIAATGTIDFKPIVPMHNANTVIKKTVTATLTGSGGLSQLLAANTDPDTTPTGTVYEVTERITGQIAFTYYVQVPHDLGDTLDLRLLSGWVGSTNTSGTVTAVNGEGPDGSGNVVLSATDVGAQPADGDLDGLAALSDGIPRRTSGTWGLVTGTPDGTKFLRDDGTWQSTSGTTYTSENARDDIAAALVAGPNVTITPNDGADTITISAASTGSSGIPASTVTTKGDLIVATGNATVNRRSVGTDGQALLADSAQTTGVSWGAPAPATHTHAASDVTSGTIATARLGSGTANASSFLRGDQAYADPNLLAAPVHAVGNSGSALTIDAASTSGYIKTITLNANCTVTLTGASSGRAALLELVLTQDATGGRTIAWPASVKWAGGAPTLSTAAAAVDRIVLVSYNAGTTWYADLIGKTYA